MMQERILRTIRRYGMIAPGDRVAVACSGGADSTALLLLLRELAGKLGCVLSVAHFNHRWRGDESDADEAFVRALASRLDLPFWTGSADETLRPAFSNNLAGSSVSSSANLESKARRMRLRFFEELVRLGRADRVAVGHTADDQAETVLHRLLRGAGPTGLAGIRPVVQSRIIRPLLEVRRQELRQWLSGRQQPWREDSSNLDRRFLRNRLRLELLPQMEQVSPQLTERLAHTAAIAVEEEAFWREYLGPILQTVVQVRREEIALSREALRRLPRAVARRALRWALAAAAAPAETSLAAVWDQPVAAGFASVERLLDWALEPPSGGTFSIRGQIAARREFEHLILTKGESCQPASRYCYSVTVPSRVAVPEIGRMFVFQLIRLAVPQPRYNGAEDRILLDLKVSGAALTLRNWQPGDRLRPPGHRKTRKLQDLFQRRRISSWERASWPVLASADQMVWARGWPVDDRFLPAQGSTEAVEVQETPWEETER